MSTPRLQLDFAAPRFRVTLAGMTVLLFGACALTAACLAYQAEVRKRAGLEVRLTEAMRRTSHDPADTARTARMIDEAAGITRELGTPWTALLADLETASHEHEGQVAVLSVEPDHDKHRVLVKAEAKDLPVALAYLERLQKSSSLRFPMLDSHELVAEDKDHPVRFAMTADWWELP